MADGRRVRTLLQKVIPSHFVPRQSGTTRSNRNWHVNRALGKRLLRGDLLHPIQIAPQSERLLMEILRNQAGCGKSRLGTLQPVPKVENTRKDYGIDRSDPPHLGPKKIARPSWLVPPGPPAWPINDSKIKTEDFVGHGVGGLLMCASCANRLVDSGVVTYGIGHFVTGKEYHNKSKARPIAIEATRRATWSSAGLPVAFRPQVIGISGKNRKKRAPTSKNGSFTISAARVAAESVRIHRRRPVGSGAGIVRMRDRCIRA